MKPLKPEAMKILQIRMKNLASLEGEQVIDFTTEPLKNCGLFSIVGPTGSGKSTCLDAVVLSLYGTSPRYHDAVTYTVYNGLKSNNDQNLSPTDPRNILREGCRDCMAQLHFIGDDGDEYVATWSVEMKRGGKTYGKPLHKLENRTHPKELTAVQNSFSLTGGRLNEDYKALQSEVIRAVGLDYDQFTRTVLLAQNSFANFLKSDGDTKGRLLEKLTGTEIYTQIGLSIYRFYKEAFDAKSALEREIEGVRTGLLDADRLKGLQTEVSELSAKATLLHTELEALKKKREWYTLLVSLTEKETVSEQQKIAHQAAYTNNEMNRKRLLRHDSVQGVNELYFALNKWTLEVEELVQKTAENSLSLAKQGVVVKDLKNEKEESELQRKQSEKELEWLSPALKQYRNLKVQAASLQDNCKKLNDELLASRKRAEEAVRLAQAKHAEREKTIQLKGAARKTLDSLATHRTMIALLPATMIQLEQLGKEVDHLADRKRRVARELNEIQPQLRKEWEELHLQKEELKSEWTNWNTQIEKEQAYLVNIDPNKLQLELASFESQTSRLKDAGTWWKSLTDALVAQRELSLQRVALERQVADERELVNQLQLQYNAKSAEHQGSKQMYTLVTGQDLNALRGSLVEGERCPVCGSDQHPYAEKNHRPSELLLKMKEQLNQLEIEVGVLTKRLDDAKQLYNKHTGLAEANAQEEKRQQRVFASLQEQGPTYANWIGEEVALNGYSEADLTSYAAKIALLQGQSKMAADALREQLSQYNMHQKELTHLQKSKDALDKRLKILEETESASKVRGAESTAQVTHLQREIEDFERTSQQLTSEISATLTIADWLNLWTSNRSAFKRALDTIFKEYNDADRQWQTAEADAIRFQSELDILLKDQLERQATVEQRAEAAQKGESDLQAIHRELKSIFKGDTADQREKRANEWLSERKTAEAALILRLAEQQSLLDTLRGEKEQLGKNQIKAVEALKSTQEKFNQWMIDYAQTYEPLEREELMDLLSAETDWEALRRSDNLLKERVDIAAGTWKAAQLNRMEHQKLQPTESEEVLLRSLQEQEGFREQLNQTLMVKGGELAAHANAEKNMGLYRERLEAVTQMYDDWRELNKIFGTTDGKGISEKAQCITLSYLVEHANVQLRQLTHRYSICQVPDSLGLKIMDHDRGDESRAISTLSGGETFLISLSLALGLSSLSSENLQIGTMFIDEGFGTLDAHSLSMVIDALSRLQSSQGRQVGVISHTEEMKNTISTRISIVRDNSGGRSMIQCE